MMKRHPIVTPTTLPLLANNPTLLNKLLRQNLICTIILLPLTLSLPIPLLLLLTLPRLPLTTLSLQLVLPRLPLFPLNWDLLLFWLLQNTQSRQA